MIAAATIASVTPCVRIGSAATSFSAIAMISADRMKSVRIAPDTFWFSSRTGSVVVSSASPWPCPLTASITFSAPSKHRNAPPIIRSGVIAQGAKALSSRATGRRISSLLRSEPSAILPMIGSSRCGASPTT